MVNKSLIKKSGLYFVGNLSSKIMSALLIPIYAFYVSADDLGYFDFSQTIMGILSPIIILAIWEAILKFVLSEDDISIKRKIMTTSALFSIIMAIVFILGAIVFNLIYEQSIKYISLIIAMIALHSLVYVWQYYARASANNKLYVIAGILSTMVNFLFVIILVIFMKMGLLGLLLAYNIGQFSIIIIIEKQIGVIRNLKLRDFEFGILKKMILFSSPLVLNLISAWIISGFGRLIVTKELGTEANGLYSFANKFSLLITMIGTVVTMAIIEEAILSVKTKGLDSNFNKTLEQLFKVFQSFALLAMPAIVMFYTIISNTDYYNSLIFTPWLLLYAVTNTMASNIGSVFQAISKTKYQFITTMLGGIVTVVVSICFIESLEITAVIIGQILGALTMMISRYILINKFIVMKINWRPIILRTFIFVVVTLICLNTSLLISILIELLLVGVTVFINRMIIKSGWNKLRAMVVRR